MVIGVIGLSRFVSCYTFYDPETYEVIVESGKAISKEAEKKLKALGYYEIAVGMNELAEQSKGMITQAIGFGRCKCALACVRLWRGEGDVKINGKSASQYFGWLSWRELLRPFEIAELKSENWNVDGKVEGSFQGSFNQKRALQHAIAGAIAQLQPNKKRILRREGFRWRKEGWQ